MKTTIVPFLLLPLLMLLPTAQASTPTVLNGPVIVNAPTFQLVRTAGSISIYAITERDTYSGPIDGTTVGESTLIMDSAGGFTVHGEHTFTGKVNGIPGTLVLLVIATGTFPTVFQGHFVILSGTDGLSNLHGQVTLQGVLGVSGEYSGQIHFGPD